VRTNAEPGTRNAERFTDGRQSGAALRPLTTLQKQKLVLLAREAFGKRGTGSGELGTEEECPFEVPGEAKVSDFDAWRRSQCMQAVERPGLTACRNEDYLPLKAHFLRILGRTEEADAAQERAEMEPRAYLFDQFRRACNAAAGAVDNPAQYAEGFLRRACKCGIDDAPDKALWRAIYLLRNKVKCEERKRKRTVAT
jgi:hypothetical protein